MRNIIKEASISGPYYGCGSCAKRGNLCCWFCDLIEIRRGGDNGWVLKRNCSCGKGECDICDEVIARLLIPYDGVSKYNLHPNE